MLKTRITSSQEKIFLDNKITDFSTMNELTALQGERVSFQLLYVDEKTNGVYIGRRPRIALTFLGELSPYATARDVRCLAVDRPADPGIEDSNYLRLEPGLYPDLLTPLRYGGMICASKDILRSVWIEIQIPEDAKGKQELTIRLEVEDTEEVIEERVFVDVIPARLPAQTVHFTQWFYADCLAAYYNVPAWSERHWEIVENFIKVGVNRGRDTMYTPLLGPALDVAPPFLRTPSQLVIVYVDNGEYSFDFSRVDRYVDMCDRLGVKQFEISHFFNQDRAKHSTHVYATKDGEDYLLFGWETLALDEEYIAFLRALITAFVAHMKERGDDRRCIYHISDEPNLECLEQYQAVKEKIIDLLHDYVIIDALSDIDFYEKKIVAHPVPRTAAAMDFIKANVPDLWIYYACGDVVDYSNCYLSMPSWRTRSLGMQLYKFKISGFLHWGYNYYNNQGSGDAINPYMELGGEDWVSAGDAFTVYPAADGTALESIRIMTMEEVMQDVRAMQLCEKYYSHGEVVAAMEKALGDTIDFKRCARSAEEMLRVRAVINEMIATKVK